jgi:hypothetical protein
MVLQPRGLRLLKKGRVDLAFSIALFCFGAFFLFGDVPLDMGRLVSLGTATQVLGPQLGRWYMAAPSIALGVLFFARFLRIREDARKNPRGLRRKDK